MEKFDSVCFMSNAGAGAIAGRHQPGQHGGLDDSLRASITGWNGGSKLRQLSGTLFWPAREATKHDSGHRLAALCRVLRTLCQLLR